MNRAQIAKTTVRMTPDVVDWLQQRAEHNVTSVTAEIIRAVRECMAQERHAARKAEVAVD